jgi:hypothetical protein
MLDKSCVYIKGERVEWNEEEMRFLNIEEDMTGRDLITFEYKGKTYQSYVTS